MRMAIAAAAVLGLFAMAAPAHAQMRTSLSGGSNANVPQNSGGGGGGGGSFGSSASGGHALNGISRDVRYQNTSAHGNEADFQLTAYVPYEQAVRMGEAALAQQAKTLGEIAAEYRASKAHRK